MNAIINALMNNESVGCKQSVLAIQFTSIGCSIVACIQSVSSKINYHIRKAINAGINAVKIYESVRWK